MKDDTRELLDGLLRRWHRWAVGYTMCADVGQSPMFRQARPGRQYETQYDIAEGQLEDSAMDAVDFHVNELPAIQRTALQINARNLWTGRSVWRSVRLPDDAEARAVVLVEARQALTARLMAAGIL